MDGGAVRPVDDRDQCFDLQSRIWAPGEQSVDTSSAHHDSSDFDGVQRDPRSVPVPVPVE